MKATESSDQWFERLNDIKAEANRLYSSKESSQVDAILLYQACVSLIRAELDAQSDPLLVQLLATLHGNMSQAYLSINDPVHAEQQARDVYFLSQPPIKTTNTNAFGPLFQMLADTSTYPLRYEIPHLTLIKAAYRLCLALLDRGMDKDVGAVVQDAQIMFGHEQTHQYFTKIQAQLTANSKKSKCLAEKMVKEFKPLRKPPPAPPESEPELQEQVPEYVHHYTGEAEFIGPISDEMLALQWEAAYEEMNAKLGDPKPIDNDPQIEWSDSDTEMQIDPDSAPDTVTGETKKLKNMDDIDLFNSDEEQDEKANMPELIDLVPGRLPIEKVHSELAKTYQPRSMYPLLKLVNNLTTNYAGIRPWVKRWPSISEGLVDHIMTQLVQNGKVQLYDISAKQKSALQLPTQIQIKDLVNATFRGKANGILGTEDSVVDDTLPAANDLDLSDIAVPFTCLANEQAVLKFMLAPKLGVHYKTTDQDVTNLCGEVDGSVDEKYMRVFKDLIERQFPVYNSYKLETLVKMAVQLKIQTPVPKSSSLFVAHSRDRVKAYIGQIVRNGHWEVVDVRMPGGPKIYIPGGGEVPFGSC